MLPSIYLGNYSWILVIALARPAFISNLFFPLKVWSSFGKFSIDFVVFSFFHLKIIFKVLEKIVELENTSLNVSLNRQNSYAKTIVFMPSLLLFRSLACIVGANDTKNNSAKKVADFSVWPSERELYMHWDYCLSCASTLAHDGIYLKPTKILLIDFFVMFEIFFSNLKTTHECGAYLSLSVSLSTAQPNSYLILEYYMQTNSFWKTDG